MTDLQGADAILNITEDNIPVERIANAQSARSLLSDLLKADSVAEERRAEIQGMIDGNAPYKEQDLKDLGQEERVNVNWGHAEGKVENACIPYYDALTSVPQFVTVQTRYGRKVDMRDKWSRIISAELHKALKKYPRFLKVHQLVHKNIVIHGTGCLAYRDGRDWRAHSIPPSSLVVPRNASVDWTEWEYCFVLDDFYAEELYRYIANEENAARNSWDVEACKASIIAANTDQPDKDRTWTWYQTELKNNSLYYSQARSKVIKGAHLYVKEFNGRYSHYIFDREKETQWLCAKVGRYENLTEAFTVFTNGVGNGSFHGVRGLGQKVYKYAEAINRVNNAIIEGAIVGSALMLQATSAGDVSKLQTIQVGPYRILPPGLQLQPVNLATNLQGPMQVASYFQGQESEQISSYLPTVNSAGPKKNNKGLEIEMGEKAQLSNTRFEIYMQDLDLHYTELYRRIASPNLLPEDPGGREALAFQKACMAQGVPKAALNPAVCEVSATRSIGQGSSAARIMAMSQIGRFVQQLPEDKRANVIRDSIAAIGGQPFVDRYAPDLVERPTGIDASIAALENNAFMQGGQVVIDPDQNHYIHCSVHLKFFAEMVEGVRQQQMDPRQALKCLQVGGPHLLMHLKQLEQDPTRKDQFTMLNQQTAELMKMADQIAKYAEQIQEQEDEQRKQQQQPQLTPEEMRAQNQIQLDTQKAQHDMQIKEAKAAQMMALKDRAAAQRLQITNLHTRQKLVHSQQTQESKYRSMNEEAE